MPTKGNRKTVAMLAHTCYLRDSRVRREAEALAEAGFKVHVISLAEERRGQKGQEPRHDVVKGVEIHRVPLTKRRGGLLRYVFEYLSMGVLGAIKLASLHLREKIDIVHVHNMPDILVLAAAVPRLGGAKLILDVHDPMPELFMTWHHCSPDGLVVRLLRLQEKFSCWLADRVISVNESMRENLRAKGVDEQKIFIVNNFPDLKVFPLRAALTSWPRKRDELVLLYCGTVTEHYDVGLAVKAMARIVSEVPIKLKILGDGNRLTEILNLASSLGVGDAVERIGPVPIDKVSEEMRNADVGISCHQSGVFGDLYFSTKIVEYLTQGLPVLTTRTPTITRYLSEDSLFYYQPGDEKGMADTLRHMWQNPAEVLRCMAAGRELVPRLSWESEKEKFVSFYAGFLGDGAPEQAISALHVESRRS